MIDPYKAKRALAETEANLTRALAEARGTEATIRAEHEAADHGDLSLLQELRTAEGFTGGLGHAKAILVEAIEKTAAICRWCGGPDDHGDDCRPAPHGTQPAVGRTP